MGTLSLPGTKLLMTGLRVSVDQHENNNNQRDRVGVPVFPTTNLLPGVRGTHTLPIILHKGRALSWGDKESQEKNIHCAHVKKPPSASLDTLTGL